MRRIRALIAASAAALALLPVGTAQAVASWTVSAAPLPADSAGPNTAGEAASSCATANFCAAVGNYLATGNSYVPYLATFSGGTWTAIPAPLPGNAGQSRLVAVSCPAAGSCVAVGSDSHGPAGVSMPLVETLERGAWRSTNPGAARGALGDVSCTTSSCVATGQVNPLASSAPLILENSSGSWKPQTVKWYGEALPMTLSGVSCPADGSGCVVSAFGRSGPLYFRRSGGPGWQGQSFGEPPEGTPVGYLMTAPSCTSDGVCLAIDTYRDSTGYSTPYELSTTDGVGSMAPIGLPPAAVTGGSVDAVSCASTMLCAAVGTYVSSHGATGGLALRRLNGVWSAQVAPLPADSEVGKPVALNAVSCHTTTSCTAVGSYSTLNANRTVFRPLIESLYTTKWTATGVGLPLATAATNSGVLAHVSCAGSRCVATGATFDRRTVSPQQPIVATSP